MAGISIAAGREIICASPESTKMVDSLMFQKDLETMPRRELEALQLERLKWAVGFCRDNIPFYREGLEGSALEVFP